MFFWQNIDTFSFSDFIITCRTSYLDYESKDNHLSDLVVLFGKKIIRMNFSFFAQTWLNPKLAANNCRNLLRVTFHHPLKNTNLIGLNLPILISTMKKIRN